MSGEKELKPCFVPSCAKHSDKRVETFFDEGQYFVRCLNCYSRGPESRKEKEAVEGWNEIHRATPPGTEIVPEGTMALLQNLEWEGHCREMDEEMCPCCAALKGSGRHSANCKLSAIIATHKDRTEKGER